MSCCPDWAGPVSSVQFLCGSSSHTQTIHMSLPAANIPPSSSNDDDDNTPLLGTEWLEGQGAPAPGQPAMPPAWVCLDLSEFRRLLSRYRKLDDTISLALNRAFSPLMSPASPQLAATAQCAQFWSLLTESWSTRERLIRSCIDVVDRAHDQPDKAQLYSAQLRRRMMHDELAVESAIRNQAFQKFRSRCLPSIFHIPPHNSPTLNLAPQPTSSSHQ